jgi:hypothetical protein
MALVLHLGGVGDCVRLMKLEDKLPRSTITMETKGKAVAAEAR